MTNLQVCVDANVIVWSLVPYPLSPVVRRLLATWQQTETVLIAPALLAFEVTSTLRRLVFLKEISPTEGEDAFARFLRIKVELSSRPSIFPLAWELAKELNRSRAYDTSYLALAQLNHCQLWTADEKFYNAVHAKRSDVKWIGNLAQK